MRYFGKRIDTFEMALNQLLVFRGKQPVEYLDCISRRSYGYAVTGPIETWFGPFLKPDEAVRNLSVSLGIGLNCRCSGRVGDFLDFLDDGAVLGPVRKGFAVPDFREYYYDGQSHFLFVSGIGNERYQIFDPLGLPGLNIGKKELMSLAGCDRIYCIYPDDDFRDWHEPDLCEVFLSGASFHNRIRNKERQEMVRSLERYEDGERSRISLRYGIMNFLLQIEQVIHLGEMTFFRDDDIEKCLCREGNKLFETISEGNIQRIPVLFDKIWELLTRVG